MASSNQVGAAEGIVLPTELESATGRAQLLRQLEAHLKSLHSGPRTEQNTLAGRLRYRPFANVPTDLLYTLIARYELEAFPLQLRRLFERDYSFLHFVVKRCQRCIPQPEYYAVNVLAGQAPYLLRDDLDLLFRDLGETPDTLEDWTTLARLMSALRFDHVHFATVRFVFRYRRRLLSKFQIPFRPSYECPRTASRFYGEWAAYTYSRYSDISFPFRLQNFEWTKATSKATAILFDKYPAWTPVFSRFALRITVALSDGHHDFRYLAKIAEARLTEISQLPAMLRANFDHFTDEAIFSLAAGSSIRQVINFNPGKRLLKAYHTFPAMPIPKTIEFWSGLFLLTTGCSVEQLIIYYPFLRQHANVNRNTPDSCWWDSNRVYTTICKMIEWRITPGPVWDYINYRMFQDDFQLTGRTLASVTRLSEQWHEELMQRRLALTKNTPRKWPKYPVEDLVTDDYRIIQLNTAEDLVREGIALGHCVGSYAHRCAGGFSSIHSLQIKHDSHWMHKATIEIRLATRQLVQARGKHNSQPEPNYKDIIVTWLASQNIGISSF